MPDFFSSVNREIATYLFHFITDNSLLYVPSFSHLVDRSSVNLNQPSPKTFFDMKIQNLYLPVTFILIVSLLVIQGCSVNNEEFEPADYEINNNEEELGLRITDTDQLIDVISPTGEVAKGKSANRSFDLTLVAKIDAPVVEDVTTQATMVDIFGNSARAAVSYNVQGATYLGAVDVVQVTSSSRNAIRVRSKINFLNATANAVYINDNELWLAQATNATSITQSGNNSVASRFGVSGFRVDDNARAVAVQGFAANSIHESDGNVYVTSGSNAGLTIMNESLTEQIDFVAIPHARWVDTDDSRIVVLSGNPNTGSGTLHVLDKNDRSVIHEHSFRGADTPEAKNTVEIHGDLAVVSAGKSGTHFIDLNTGDILTTIPVPNAGALNLDPDAVESNAASADDEFVFISNGEAGVYVAEANIELNRYTTGNSLNVNLLGYLQFDEFQSANHVAYRNNTLFVAAGLGGVKAVKLKRK